MTVTFLLRVNINLAIVGMVKSTIVELASEGAQLNVSGGCVAANVSVSTNKQVRTKQRHCHIPFKFVAVSQDFQVTACLRTDRDKVKGKAAPRLNQVPCHADVSCT